MAMTMADPSARSVQYLKGIGPSRYALLQKLGIHTIRDLTYFFPRRYEDRSQLTPIGQIRAGQFVSIQGNVESVRLKPLKRLKILEVSIKDNTGEIWAVWFNQVYLKQQINEGKKIVVSGKAEMYQNRLQLPSPDYEIIDSDIDDPIHVGRIIPIYALTDGLFQRSLRRVVSEMVDKKFYGAVTDFLPQALREKHKLICLETALKEIHFPSSLKKLDTARQRLIYDELFLLELKLLKKTWEIKLKQNAIPLKAPPNLFENFCQNIPFALTKDQEKAIKEVSADLAQSFPMHRLLQGEVGSGKTVIAAFAMKLAATNQQQSAFLVPTEILAEQHFLTLKKFFEPQDMRIELLTASTIDVVRRDILRGVENGSINVLVGTHALLQESVGFKDLGLVVIDEQHKFGVEQRAKLMGRAPKPHLLIMSATPIPRTLGLTLFGDLNITTLRELPKGRKKISTILVSPDEIHTIYDLACQFVNRGEQVYILYPLIEQSDKLEAQSAKEEYDNLSKREFKDIRVGLIHGRIPKPERDMIMEEFRNGSIKILVATTVIEVGVDNPNATLMIIHNADRFGLSQLHQIRGRIGRGSKISTCVLVSSPKTEGAEKRLEILLKSNDGFEIADADLKLRGPGEFLGFKQSGIADLKIADMVRDEEVLLQAREDASEILGRDPNLESPEHHLLRKIIQ